jgi:tetratricopeptide (TPR) repeat protein
MRRWPGKLVRRPWLALFLLGVLGTTAWLAAPHLRAWYHWRAGRSALERYHHEEALCHFRACLAVWPGDVRAHLLACRAARRAEDYEEAQQQLRAAQALQGQPNEETVLEWALLQASLGGLDQVEEHLLDRARRYPSQAPLAWEALAEGYTRLYRILDALACLDRWLARQPDNVRALALRGNAYWQIGRSQQAAEPYRRVIELGPDNTEVRWRLGRCMLDVGRYQEALDHFQVVLRRRPNDPDVLVRLARCYERLDQPERARDLLDEVLAEHPGHGEALRTRGRLARKSGDLAGAERWLREAVRTLPNDYLVNFALYEVLRDRQKGPKEVHAQLARAERVKDRRERLAEITTRQMSARPLDPNLHAELGALLIELGSEEAGERWLLSALQRDSNCRAAHTALAGYYQSKGDADRAAEHRRLAAQAQATSGPSGR